MRDMAAVVASSCRAFQTALVLLPPVWGSDPTPRRKRSVSKNDHDHENPSSCWQRSLNGGHPPRLFSITVRRVCLGSRAAVARCGERVSLAPESRPTASSIDYLFSANSGQTEAT